MRIPTIDDIHAAAERIKSYALKTPLLEWPVLNERVGGRVFIKAETLQRTGSFKFRGAFNRISQISRDEYPGGVVACSSGNHAQGVAHASTLCGLSSVIVMPSDAPKIKIERTRAFGAEVVFYNRLTEDREAIARDLCEKRSAAFVPPFDDPDVIAGQGTASLEMAAEAKASGAKLDATLAPASGGGLVAGMAIAIKDAFPDAEVYCVEPAGFDDYKRSLETGAIQANSRAGGSICDSLLAKEPGQLTFAVNKERLAGSVVVTDDDALEAVAFAFRELKLVIEPGGAVGLAALLKGIFPVEGRTVGIIASGGNVDPALYCEILQKA